MYGNWVRVSFDSVGIAHPLQRARAELTQERYDAAAARARDTPVDQIVQLALAPAASALDAVVTPEEDLGPN